MLHGSHAGFLIIEEGSPTGEAGKYPLVHGWNEYFGRSIKVMQTHHFLYNNQDFKADHLFTGWRVEADKDWEYRANREEADIFFSSQNPWRN
jgi:hypothetical protein